MKAWKIFIIIFVGSVSAWSAPTVINSQSEKMHWYEPTGKAQQIPAAALVVHGLNNHPQVMLPIVDFLRSQGIGVLNVGLTGYVGDHNNLKKVTAEQWRQDVLKANQALQNKAPHVPKIFIGYSLGALIGETLMTSELKEKFAFQKAILFSPALRVRDSSRWIQMFSFLGPGFSMISLAPKSYAAYRGTPNAAYRALFTLLEQYDHNLSHRSEQGNIPTLIFADVKDELVSVPSIQKMITLYDFNQWQFYEIKKDPTAKTWFHHVTIDGPGVGNQTWREMCQQMSEFLN
jgi:esterase/lipase